MEGAGGCRRGRVELGEQGIEFYRKLGRSQSNKYGKGRITYVNLVSRLEAVVGVEGDVNLDPGHDVHQLYYRHLYKCSVRKRGAW